MESYWIFPSGVHLGYFGSVPLEFKTTSYDGLERSLGHFSQDKNELRLNV
jgi:hypothetical protein